MDALFGLPLKKSGGISPYDQRLGNLFLVNSVVLMSLCLKPKGLVLDLMYVSYLISKLFCYESLFV